MILVTICLVCVIISLAKATAKTSRSLCFPREGIITTCCMYLHLFKDIKPEQLKSVLNPDPNTEMGQFLVSPVKLSAVFGLDSKISNLTITKLFYSHMNRGSLHTRSFRRIHFSFVRYRLTKNGFTGAKRSRGFRETRLWTQLLCFVCMYGNAITERLYGYINISANCYL